MTMTRDEIAYLLNVISIGHSGRLIVRTRIHSEIEMLQGGGYHSVPNNQFYKIAKHYIDFSSVKETIESKSWYKIKRCPICNSLFSSNKKWCSDYCKSLSHKKSKQDSAKRKVKKNQDIGYIDSKRRDKMRDFEGADRSYSIIKGKEDMKNILECSTECLLQELGDIE